MSYNKCYVQAFGEEGGDIILEIFANPSDGPERLVHIQTFWDRLLNGTVVKVDSARAYLAAALDSPEKMIVLCRINHKQAKDYGLCWYLAVTEENEHLFGHLAETIEGQKFFRVISYNL